MSIHPIRNRSKRQKVLLTGLMIVGTTIVAIIRDLRTAYEVSLVMLCRQVDDAELRYGRAQQVLATYNHSSQLEYFIALKRELETIHRNLKQALPELRYVVQQDGNREVADFPSHHFIDNSLLTRADRLAADIMTMLVDVNRRIETLQTEQSNERVSASA